MKGLLLLALAICTAGVQAQEGNGCTESVNQSIYTLRAEEPIQTSTIPIISGKRLEYTVGLLMQDREEESQRLKDVVMVLDYNADIPAFMVFDKRGRPYCSHNGKLLDFPDHFSYRALTRNHKVVTAGVLPSDPIRPGQTVRRLVNDNINKEPIDEIKADDIVMEVYRIKNWMGDSYTIRVHATPAELDNYRNDIIAMIKKGYDDLENIKELEPEELEIEDDGEDFEHDGERELFTMEAMGKRDASKSAQQEDQTPGLADVKVEEESGKMPQKSKKEKEAEEAELQAMLDEERREEEAKAAAEAKEEEEEHLEELEEEEIVVEESAAAIEEEAITEEEQANIGRRDIPKLEESISEEEMSEIQEQAEMKLKELESVFVKLTNRKLNSGQKKRVRESAVEELFINERAHVAVSSLSTTELSFYPIPDYLYRLETLIAGVYQQVEVVFSEIHKVTNFKPNPDGTWSATVTFSQQFKGYKDLDGRQPTYSDITQKNVTVKIRRVELFTGDTTPEVYWEVLLADIGVNQTEPFKN